MALISTLTLGGMVWCWGLSQGANRAARGLGAWVAWAILFVFVAALVAARARRAAGPRCDQGIRVWWAVRDTGLLSFVAVLVLVFIMPAVAGDFGVNNWGAAVVIGFGLIPWGVALAALAPTLQRRLVRDPLPGSETPSATAAVLALLPMLLPAVVLFAQLHLPVAPAWAGRLAGRGFAGITFLQLETISWPAALLVAWALDLMDGSRSRPVHRRVAVLAVVALLLCLVAPPVVDGASVYSLGRPQPSQEGAAPLSFTPLLRSVAAMLAACTALSVDWLLRTRRVDWRPASWSLVLLLGLPPPLFLFAGSLAPAAIPLAAVAGCAAAFLATRLADHGRRAVED